MLSTLCVETEHRSLQIKTFYLFTVKLIYSNRHFISLYKFSNWNSIFKSIYWFFFHTSTESSFNCVAQILYYISFYFTLNGRVHSIDIFPLSTSTSFSFVVSLIVGWLYPIGFFFFFNLKFQHQLSDQLKIYNFLL